MTRQEFMQEYWRYYLMLEKKFIHTLSYVELATSNYMCYSNEYALLLQSIGAELDSFFKVYCGFDLDNRKNMTDYAKSVLNSYPKIKEQVIDVPAYSLSFIPFEAWTGDSHSQPLAWWKAFNDIKHKRSKYKTEASLQNVLHSLGALYLLEIKYLQNITLNTDAADTPDEDSLIFTLRNWNPHFHILTKDYALSSLDNTTPTLDDNNT